MSPDLNTHFVAVVTFDPASLSPRRQSYVVKPLEALPGESVADVRQRFEDVGHSAVIFPAANAGEAQVIADEALPPADNVADVRIMTEGQVTAALQERRAALTL